MKGSSIVTDNHFCFPAGFLRCRTGDALKSLPFPAEGLIRAEMHSQLPSWLKQISNWRRIAGKEAGGGRGRCVCVCERGEAGGGVVGGEVTRR